MSKRISIFDHVGKKAGMDYYSSSLAKGFVNQDCDVSVYSNFVGIEPSIIDYVPVFEGHTLGGSVKKLFKFIRATLQASHDARKKKADLVVLHLFSAVPVMVPLILIPKLFGLKTAVISHDVSSFTDRDSSIVQNLIYNVLTDNIIVHNQFSYETLLKSIAIKDPKKVVIIKHGGYLDHIGERPQRETVRKELGLEPAGKYMLFFGQIKDAKGLDVLLDAMCKIPDDIKLIIAGKPWRGDFTRYGQQIESLGLTNRIVKMIRFIEDDEREKLFFSSDVNILPYRVIFQSGVLLMAMSHGLPVIASDLPANKEIITHKENGMLFESGDADDLARQIKTFFETGHLAGDIGKKALETIEKDYSWGKIATQYLRLL
ncbi:hypothetical protein AU255_08595 [Methyloprofundus sedimenti]|uniref:Glycosyl transferase family 1 domain-containing protein n=1 Tax=Methyloprofundus sedimenti TaxID=1420851 RepID=A0A1V8M8I8_9GAMM|nr:glycosyltransferase family 4 protein [Methyloprofundus sedimenti]OQK17904.1 hypothetical protein AU255_08595 [Methyloprofundus sedimenti]